MKKSSHRGKPAAAGKRPNGSGCPIDSAQGVDPDQVGVTHKKAASDLPAAGSDQVGAHRPNGEGPRSSGKSASSPKRASAAAPATPTDPAAMQDAAAFVNAVAARADLVQVSAKLVGSEDEKIAKSELDRLRDMKFGKVSVAGGPGDEPQSIILDAPRPSE